MFRVIPFQSVLSVFRMRNDVIPRDSAVPRLPRSKKIAILRRTLGIIKNCLSNQPKYTFLFHRRSNKLQKIRNIKKISLYKNKKTDNEK